ncbi:MAG: M23 family metallopeptidase, partial [Flavobacteriales bacterium]
KRTGSVEAAVNAYNGNGVHNGRTYAQIIFGHYEGFQPIVNAPLSESQNTNFGSYPVSGTPRITQNFHGAHPGLDIVGSGDILAVMDGVVQYVGPLYKSANSSPQCAKAGCLGGYSVVLNHGGGTFTIYGHNSESYVQTGEQVKAGQAIARMGSEGRSTGPHLHFELRKNETWNGNVDWPWSRAYRSADNPTGYLP